MRRVLCWSLVGCAVALLCVAVRAQEEKKADTKKDDAKKEEVKKEDVKKVELGKDDWVGFYLVGFNPYGDQKSFYSTPIKYADWQQIMIHSRGGLERRGAEEKTVLMRFDLKKLEKAKVKEAKLIFPLSANAGKANAVQVFEVLAPWDDKVDWEKTDGKTEWQVAGCHGGKDKKKAADIPIPDEKVTGTAPKEVSADVTNVVKAWVSGASPNNGFKFEMTGGYVNFLAKGFRIEVTLE
jgi:hypothetical protein